MAETAGIEIVVSFTTSAAEQARAARRIFRLSWAWWLAMICFAVFPLCLAGFMFFRFGWYRQVGHMLGIALCGGLAWHFGMPWVGVFAARRSFPNMNGPYTWTLRDDGCTIATPAITTHLRWDAIVRVRETTDFLLFYISASAAHFLPKRALAPQLEPGLRALLARVGRA